ncbi:MAG TPA: hypothetical protein VGL44_12070 [Gaiellales bacterium]
MRDGGCAEHGPWQPHQLATAGDRRAASRGSWQGFEPLLHACPRCLGDVAETRQGFECAHHAHGRDPHGPYQVDELLGVTAQREGAASRARLVHRVRRQRRPRPQRPILPPIDAARMWRLIAAATVLAATVAFLSR